MEKREINFIGRIYLIDDLGYSQENKNHFIMKFCTLSMKDGRFDYEEQISRGPKQKLCNYIRTCLKDSLMERLSALAAK